MGVRGRYLEVTPPTRLTMGWEWDDEDADTSEVAVELRPAASGGTVVTVTHCANRSALARDGHAQGWADCLGRLLQHAPESGPIAGS